MTDPLAHFTPQVREWFGRAFAAPTEAQAQAWPAIATGEHVLISAPTGSGKTLAAFLYGLDRFVARPTHEQTRLVYVSPLKALSYDVEKNLRAPLRGIGAELNVAIRTGDTPQKERRDMVKHPPDVLITTPESLYLMLTSQARAIFEGTETVILDEIHAVAQTKRGAHLAISLERLVEAAGRDVQRVGLSATQNPLEEVGRFMVGPSRQGHGRRHRRAQAARPEDPRAGRVDGRARAGEHGARPVRRPGGDAQVDLAGDLPRAAQAGASEHRSTLIFVNNRRAAERLALRLNELAEEPLARAHHGSLAREERLVVEEQLKAGELPCLVATSSLELGIDMGAVDLVLQVESPKSVTAGLQRIGRAGHNVGDTSKGRIFPKFRADLLECAVVAQRMREGKIETTVVPRNPLDVLAQQIVAMAARPRTSRWPSTSSRRCWPARYTYAELSRTQLENVLDMLDGRYPSEEFGELRPRIVWDRVAGTIRARKGSRALAITNAGTIPDRGLYSRQPAGRPPRRRARRGDGLRGARGPGLPARRVVVADRGDHARPRDRHARAGRPGRGAVLEGRRAGPAARARRGDRRVRALGGRAGRGDAGRRLRPRPAGGAQPARVPARAAGGDARRAERPHDRDRALPRRDRRLARVRAVAVRRARARRLGAAL